MGNHYLPRSEICVDLTAFFVLLSFTTGVSSEMEEWIH
jgi:hypothetical protein